MAGPKGCLKTSGLGCLIIIGLALVGLAIMAILAATGLNKGGQVEQEVAPSAAPGLVMTDPAALTTRHPGRVVLDLGQGEFHVHPAAPGAGLSARAAFDTEVHAITESYEVNADSTWIYRLGFEQTMPAMQAIFRSIMGGDTDAVIHVYLPPDVPIELVMGMSQGGGEIELGGLWLRTLDITVRQGGFAMSVDEPLREPVERLRLHSRMGGLEVQRLGNASPLALDIDCSMGGGDIDLNGEWRNDCDARFAVKMGGMQVTVPRHMEIEGEFGEARTERLGRADTEVALPTMRATVVQSMGEVELRR